MDFVQKLPYHVPDSVRLVNEAGRGRTLGPAGLPSPPREFGSLIRVIQEKREGKGYHNWVLLRSDQDRGTIDYGLRRNNSDIYEQAKFNILLKPRIYVEGHDELPAKFNNPNYWDRRATVYNLSESERAMLQLARWPRVPNALTIAPFVPRRGDFMEKAVEQTWSQGLTKIMKVPELWEIVMNHLIADWESVSNFSRTCRQAFMAVRGSWTHLSNGDSGFRGLAFNLNNIIPLYKINNCPNEGANDFDSEPEEPKDRDRTAGSIVLYSPCRQYEQDEYEYKPELVGKDGIYRDESIQWNNPGSIREAKDHIRLLYTIHHSSRSIRHLIIQRDRYLDVRGVCAILSSLPKLESLSIHNCGKLTIGHTSSLLEAVMQSNEDRCKMDRPRVDLDFFPRFYQGPIDDGQCYGAMWQDDGKHNMLTSVVAILLKVIPTARRAGIELVKPGKAFRRFLDKLPFHFGTLECILETIYKLQDLEKGVFGVRSGFQPHEEMARTLFYELLIAITGKIGQLEQLAAQMEILKGPIHLTVCTKCQVAVPASFFLQDQMNRQAQHRKCLGCNFSDALEYQLYDFNTIRTELNNGLWKRESIKSLESLFQPTNKRRLKHFIQKAGGIDVMVQEKDNFIHDQLDEIEQVQEEMDESHRADTLQYRSYEKKLKKLWEKVSTIKQTTGGQDNQVMHPAAESWDTRIRHMRVKINTAMYGREDMFGLDNNAPYNIRSSRWEEDYVGNCFEASVIDEQEQELEAAAKAAKEEEENSADAQQQQTYDGDDDDNEHLIPISELILPEEIPHFSNYARDILLLPKKPNNDPTMQQKLSTLPDYIMAIIGKKAAFLRSEREKNNNEFPKATRPTEEQIHGALDRLLLLPPYRVSSEVESFGEEDEREPRSSTGTRTPAEMTTTTMIMGTETTDSGGDDGSRDSSISSGNDRGRSRSPQREEKEQEQEKQQQQQPKMTYAAASLRGMGFLTEKNQEEQKGKKQHGNASSSPPRETKLPRSSTPTASSPVASHSSSSPSPSSPKSTNPKRASSPLSPSSFSYAAALKGKVTPTKNKQKKKQEEEEQETKEQQQKQQQVSSSPAFSSSSSKPKTKTTKARVVDDSSSHPAAAASSSTSSNKPLPPPMPTETETKASSSFSSAIETMAAAWQDFGRKHTHTHLGKA